MDDLDRRLIEAWGQRKRAAGNRAAHRRVGRTYERPVRSRCLVLRANGWRIYDLGEGAVVPSVGYVEEEPGVECNVQGVRVDAEVVRRLCGPVSIFWPGVSVGQAARRFGAHVATCHTFTNLTASALVPLEAVPDAVSVTHSLPSPAN